MADITFTLSDSEVNLLLETLSQGASNIERERYEQLRDGFKEQANQLSEQLVKVNQLEAEILSIITTHKPKPPINADLAGVPTTHYYLGLITTLTDLINQLDQNTSVDPYYFIELRHDLIHHNSSDDIVRLLCRGYLKSLLDNGLIVQSLYDKYFDRIENYYWTRSEQ